MNAGPSLISHYPCRSRPTKVPERVVNLNTSSAALKATAALERHLYMPRVNGRHFRWRINGEQTVAGRSWKIMCSMVLKIRTGIEYR